MASASPEPSQFRTDIEGLRAVAVLGVLAFHAGVPHFAGGYVGVDVFYVISGFLITSLMVRDARTTPTIGAFLTAFYARRVRRILPASSLVLVATLLGAAVLQNRLENVGVAGDALATALFVSNIRFAWRASDYFAADNAPSPFLQYWSLSLEEQFYFFWPIIFFALFLLATRYRRRNILVGGLVAICAASFGLSLYLMHKDPIRAFYLLPPRAWELGLGALVALHAEKLAALRSSVRNAAMAVGLLAIVAVMVLFTSSTPFPGWTALGPTLGTALVIAGGCGRPATGPVHRILAWTPMQLVGKYSYSLYLWHWPVLVLKIETFKRLYATWPIRTAFMLAVTVPAAVLTYHLVENPVRSARSLKRHASRTMAVGLGLVIASIAGVWAFQRLGGDARLSTDRVVEATAGKLGAAVVPRDFVPRNLIPPLEDTKDRNYVQCGSPCVVGSPEAKHKIVLFGNSFAGHWGGAFDAAAPRLDARVEIHAPGGCTSFLIPVELLPSTDRSTCGPRRERVFTSMAKDPPDIVVLSNKSSEVFEENPAEWERGVREAIRRMPRSSTVLVFAETPRGKEAIPLCLAKNLEHAERCDVRWPEKVNKNLERITVEEGARFVDLRSEFCRDGRCPAITEDMLIYADRGHLTVPFSRAKGDWLTATLQPVLEERPARGK
jgi:peptidoglycan/LPS O-acetylase OafA/YrhL